MILLETERLFLRNWRDEDRVAMHRLNSDETVMKYFPFRRSRIDSNLFLETVKSRISATGYGWAAVELKKTGVVIGFTGISNFTADVPFAPVVEIGWRFLPEHWGNGYATESARAWLQFGFSKLGLKEITSFAVAENTGSTAVMTRLGMQPQPQLDFDHPSVDDAHANLRRHVVYSISKTAFDELNG